MKNFKEFLIDAKRNSYAKENSKPRLIKNGGKKLIYSKGGFSYQDTYFGFNPFAGEEIILKKGKAIWVMNYYGKVTSKIPPAKIYKFLKKALRKVNSKNPLRGPKKLKEKGWRYINKTKGNINEFVGIEKIFFKGKEIYKLYYHGGIIRK